MKKDHFRIVFMGTPEFAVASLKALIREHFHIAGVITAPDKPAGRGQKLMSSAVKKYALETGINPILQPSNLKDPDFLEDLRLLKPDLQVVVAFRMLPEAVWALPSSGTINLHASLLPQYRGAAPINRVIMNGEKETGVTTFFIREEIDTGNILFREKVPVDDLETAGELHDRLMVIGSDLVVRTVSSILDGTFTLTRQSELIVANEVLKSAPKIHMEDCQIDWQKDTETIFNFIRGLSPYPAAWTEWTGRNNQKLFLKIFRAEMERLEHPLEPGRWFTDHKRYLKVTCTDGYIHITELQQAGKKRMKVEEFLRGTRNLSDEC